MKLKNLLLLTIIFAASLAYGFTDQIDLFDSVVLFGDIHLGATDKHKHATLTKKQLVFVHKKQALEILEIAKKNDCVVIVEDMYDYQGDDKDAKYFFNDFCVKKNKLNNNSTCIHCLNNACKKSDVKVINIEYRHNFSYFFYQEEIRAKDFLKDLNALISEIESYDDSDVANAFYKEKLNNFSKESKKFLKILSKNKDKYFSDIFSNDSKLVENFKLQYHLLFDLKLLHTIIENQENNILVCVGRRHAFDMIPILKKLGFKHEQHLNNNCEPINIKETLSNYKATLTS